MGTGNPHRSGIHARSKERRVPLHENDKTDRYLRCLWAGACVVDPGDLDYITECELNRLTIEGVLICETNHDRKQWKKA